jgi:hypothetical protein
MVWPLNVFVFVSEVGAGEQGAGDRDGGGGRRRRQTLALRSRVYSV